MTDLRYKVISCDHEEGVQISDELKQEWVSPDDCVELLNTHAEHIAELEKERDELKIQLDVLAFENETNHECYVNLLFSNKSTEVNLQAHNLEQVDKFILFCKNASSLTGLDKLQIHSLGILYSQQAKTLKDGDV